MNKQLQATAQITLHMDIKGVLSAYLKLSVSFSVEITAILNIICENERGIFERHEVK